MKSKCTHSKGIVPLMGGGNWCGNCGALQAQWASSLKMIWRHPDNGTPEMADFINRVAYEAVDPVVGGARDILDALTQDARALLPRINKETP